MQFIEDWCKGSTTDFDSVGLGSNPESSAMGWMPQSQKTSLEFTALSNLKNSGINGSVVQRLERLSVTQDVVGSNPIGTANILDWRNR